MSLILGKTLPGVGYTDQPHRGWADMLEESLRTMDAMLQGTASMVDELPLTPANGEVIILSDVAADIAKRGHIGRWNAFGMAWEWMVPVMGWKMAIDGVQATYIGGMWVRETAEPGVPLLRFIPYQYWANIDNNTGPIYDASDAIEAAYNDLPIGGVLLLPAGRIKLTRTWNILKPIRISGSCPDQSGHGTEIWRDTALNAPAIVIGNEADSGGFMNMLTMENITFRESSQYVIGGSLKTAHWMHINGAFKGVMSNCVFNIDAIGACIYLRRFQDFTFINCFFRGGGSDLGDNAQILFGPPQVSIETDYHAVNEVNFLYCHFEWGPNTGNAYVDPATGLDAPAGDSGYRPSRGSVAVKAVGIFNNSKANNCTWISCKFEMTTSRNWDGESLRKSGIHLVDVTGFQFLGCRWAQTSRPFYARSCPALVIQGVTFYGGGQGAADNRRRFGTFISCDQLRIDVQGSYAQPGARVIKCPGAEVNVDSAIGTVGSPRYSMEEKARFGGRYMQTFFKTLTGSTLIEDKRASTGHAYLSREIATEDDYGVSVLELTPTNRKERPNGMTIKAKVCLESAPTGTHILQFKWHWFPRDIEYYDEPDGIKTEWDVPMYFAPDSDFPGSEEVLNPITAWKRHKVTGVETAVTIVTKNGENDFNGGSVVLAEAVPATHEVVIRRQSYGKGIITLPSTGTLTTTPTWYTAYIPPNVLKLEGVVIQVCHGGDWGAGLRYLILDWDFAEEAESPTIPYYPAGSAFSGPGLPPNGNGWTTKSMVRCQTATQGGTYYRYLSTEVTGVGVWALLTPAFTTFAYDGAGGAHSLPTIASFGNIAGLRYTVHNIGTGDLVVSPSGSDIIASTTWTSYSFTLAPGESASLEIVPLTGTGLVWVIMLGIPCMAAISANSNPSQVIATGAAQKVTMFNNNVFSKNCSADQANDRIIIHRSGTYRADLNFSGPITPATPMLTWTIKVDGVTVGHLKGLEYFGAADQAEMCTLSCPIGSIVAGKDIELWVASNSGAGVTVTAWNLTLSVERIA